MNLEIFTMVPMWVLVHPKVSNNVATLKSFHCPMLQKGLQSITNFEIFICFCYLLEMGFFIIMWQAFFLKVERHFFFWVVFALQLTFWQTFNLQKIKTKTLNLFDDNFGIITSSIIYKKCFHSSSLVLQQQILLQQ
jgi:hypothetical protein